MNQKPIDSQSELFDQGISSIKQWFQEKPRDSLGTETKTEHVPLAPEVIGHVGSFPITNSLVFSILVTFLLSVFAIVFSRKIAVIPGKLQSLIEVMFEYVYDLGESLAKSRIKSLFPWVMTFFLYILAANLLALFPGVSTIGIYEMHEGQQKFIPLLRSINSDLNMTLSLALLSVIATHFFSLKFIGVKDY